MLKQLRVLLNNEFDPAFAKRAEDIFETVEQLKPGKILDAGCGRGFYSHSLSLFPFVKEIHGVDINTEYISIAKKHCTDKKIKLTKASLCSLPYPDDYFDYIVFSEVLEHISDEEKALNELRRVLKKGGIMSITVPHDNYPFLWDPLNWLLEKTTKRHIPKHIWWLAGIWADHERLYSEENLLSLIRKTHYKIKSSHRTLNWCWPFSHFLLYGLGKNILSLFHIREFNRFDFYPKKSIIQLLAKLFSFPSFFLDKKIPLQSSVNIILTVQKC